MPVLFSKLTITIIFAFYMQPLLNFALCKICEHCDIKRDTFIQKKDTM